MDMRKPIALLLCLLLLAALGPACTPMPTASVPSEATASPVPDATAAPRLAVVELSIAMPAATESPAPPAPTSVPAREHPAYTFQPKVASSYMGEVFGEAMVETWFNLVDAVMAGETAFACPDDHTYNWVMGQFPDRCLPPLCGQIEPDPAADPDHPVVDGVGRFRYVTSAEEVAARIAAFAEQTENILNGVLKADDTDFEKCFALYRYFCETYQYDYNAYFQMYDEYLDYLCSYRLFDTGEGICCEIAPAYAYLLLQAGVDAGTMGGHDHDWAYVKLNGKNYHIDPTFAINTAGALAYFLMDDGQRAAEGYPRSQHVIVSNYAQDHPHPDYAADDDTFRPLWEGFDGVLDRPAHTLRYLTYDLAGDPAEALFDYSGY